MYRSSGQKPNREIIKLTDVMNQIDLIDYLQKISSQHTHTQNYTSDHILDHKASLNEYKKIEITPSSLSDHHGLKLDFSNRNNRKLTNSWKLSNSLWNDY